MIFKRFIVLGDSFSEGMCDEMRGGQYRGWADRMADVLATQTVGFTYANFAIRGKLVKQVLDEQIPLALPFITGPETLLSFHAGANDAIRPSYDPVATKKSYNDALEILSKTGAKVIVFTVAEKAGTGGKASAVWQERFSSFNSIVREAANKYGFQIMDATKDPETGNVDLVAFDRLHLNEEGHYRVAHAVLAELRLPHDKDWSKPVLPPAKKSWIVRKALAVKWVFTFVFPWIWRRARGKSSGDGRSGKYESPISWPLN